MKLGDLLTENGKKWCRSKKWPLRTEIKHSPNHRYMEDGHPNCCGAACPRSEMLHTKGHIITDVVENHVLNRCSIFVYTLKGRQAKKLPHFTALGFKSSGWVPNPNMGNKTKICALTLAIPKGIFKSDVRDLLGDLEREEDYDDFW